MATRSFLIGGMIQFPITDGKVLIPLQEVTPGASSNLLACDPDQSVLDAVRTDAMKAADAPWGNDEVMIVAQAWLSLRNPGDTCTLYTADAWSAKQSADAAAAASEPVNAPVIDPDAALIAAATALTPKT